MLELVWHWPARLFAWPVFVSFVMLAACVQQVPYSSLQEREGLYYRAGESDPYSGTAEDRYPDGKIKADLHFRRGKLQGICSQWHENGRIKEIAEFADGLQQGKCRKFFANGRVKSTGEYLMGRNHGPFQAWREDGTLVFSRYYLDGRANGLWQDFYPNRNIRSERRFQVGEFAGAQADWYPDGSPKSLVSLRAEVWQDRWLNWHGNGRLKLHAACTASTRTWRWRMWNLAGQELTAIDRPVLRGLFPFFFASEGQFAKKEQKAIAPSLHSQTLASLRLLDANPLYSLRYSGGYGMVEFLLHGLAEDWHGLKESYKDDSEHACSTFAARNRSREVIFGHNDDWKSHPVLVLFTAPPGGYSSLSLVNLLALNEAYVVPVMAELQGKSTYLRAPYFTQQGMNECGLAVAAMSSPGQDALFDPRRTSLKHEQLIRVVLDYAANVEEALQLIGNYNNVCSAGQHFLLADSSGRSVVVEYMGGEVVTIPGRPPGQVARECWRYKAGIRWLLRQNEVTLSNAMYMLQALSMTEPLETISSTVYNLKTGEVRLALNRKFARQFSFQLPLRRISR